MRSNSRASDKSARLKGLKNLSAFSLQVLDMAEGGLEVLTASRIHQRALIAGGFDEVRRILDVEEARQIYRRVQRLKKRHLLEEREMGRRLIFSLTQRGSAYVLKRKFQSAAPRADGRNTYVLFDIPEREKRRRDFLRGFLKSAGFRKLQWSVWLSEKDVSALLDDWINENKLSRWLTVIVGCKVR